MSQPLRTGRKRRALLPMGAALALVWWAACGEDGEGPTGGGTGSGAAGAGGTSSTSSSSSSSTASSSSGVGGEAPCEPEPLPEGVPAGWLEYTDWSCTCRFYEPGSVEALPAPIAWEPCPAVGDGIECQMMVVDWTDSQTAVAVDPKMDVGNDGTVVLAFSRTGGLGYQIHIVAEADGPVHSAMIWHYQGENDPKCLLDPEDMNEGMVVYRTRGLYAHGLKTTDQGAIGGPIDELHPKLLIKALDVGDVLGENWYAGSGWVAQLTSPTALWAHRWDLSESFLVHKASVDPEGMPPGQIQVVGEAVFFKTSSGYRHGINVWDAENGFRPFIRFLGDATRGAANLGTDKIDMVWSYGEGKQPTDTSYPIRSVMTAPFTTDPDAVVPRRLRSQLAEDMGLEAWEVGCGTAVHFGAAGLQVVRISDGWSWAIPYAPQRGLSVPLGVTCEEVFALGYVGGHDNIARVRLDSLGPGVPPD